MMDKTEFLKEMEILLETEPGTLTGRENLDQLADWNSLAIISFLVTWAFLGLMQRDSRGLRRL